MNKEQGQEPAKQAGSGELGDKEIVSALEFLSKTHRQLHDQRRKYEYKVFLTTLTFYVLCVGATYADTVRLPNHRGFYVAIFIAFLLLVYLSSSMLARIHGANWINIKSAELLEIEIVDIIEKRRPRVRPPGWDPDREQQHHHLYWQIALIGLFAVASTVMIFSNSAG